MSDRGVRDDHRLDRMLRAGDPIRGRWPADSALEAAFDSMIASIASEPRQTPRRRRSAKRPRAALAGIAAFVALSAGAAGAATQLFVPTHSHRYVPEGMIAGGGPGELLYVDGTDFRRIALRISSDIPYPNGFGSWREYVISSEYQLQREGCPAASTPGRASGTPSSGCQPKVPAGQLHGAFASTAFDAWVLDWRHELMTGRRAAARRDARVISGVLGWKAVRAWDLHPSTSVAGDGGTTHPSQFSWMIPFIRAVGAGDLRGVERLILSTRYGGPFAGACPFSVAPHLAGRTLLSYLDRHGI